MTWGRIILLVLQGVMLVISWAQRNGYIREGYDKAIAEVSREIFRKTEHAKAVKEKIDAMSDDEVDAALVGLEPNDVPAHSN